MANIIVTAKKTTFHPDEKIGPLITGQQYIIDETQFAPELFSYAGTIGIKPCPGADERYTTTPSVTFRSPAAGGGDSCGNGIYAGASICSDDPAPYYLMPVFCSYKYYCGQGMYSNYGI